MKHTTFFLSLLWLLINPSYGQYTLMGKLTFQNSDNQPVVAAQISTPDGAETAVSNDAGAFTLIFPDKGLDDKVLLHIEKAGYEVVNQRALLHTLTADAQPINLYLSHKEEWQKNAVFYYLIFETHLAQRYQEEREGIQKESKHDQAWKDARMLQLDRQYRALLPQAWDWATQLARTNLDMVTDLYAEVLEYVRAGEIQTSINIMTATRLDQHLQEIEEEMGKGQEMISIGQDKAVRAAEAWQQGIAHYVLKAHLLVLDFRLDEAEQNLSQAVQTNNHQLDVHMRYAAFLQQQHRFAEAKTAWEESLKRTNKPIQHATILKNQGRLYLAQNNYPEAISTFKKAEKLTRQLFKYQPDEYLPELAAILQSLGDAYRSSASWDLATLNYQEALAIYRKLDLANPTVYKSHLATCLLQLGASLEQQKAYEAGEKATYEASEIFRQLVNENPFLHTSSFALSLEHLGRVLWQQKKHEAAWKYAKEAVGVWRPLVKESIARFGLQMAHSLITMGLIYQDLAYASSAKVAFLEAGSLLERCADSDEKTQMQKLLRKKLKVEDFSPDPNLIDVFTQKIEAATSHGARARIQQEFIGFLEDLYKDYPLDQDVRRYLSNELGTLSWFKLFVHDFEGAEAAARRALALCPDEYWINTNLAHALLCQGKYEEAKAVYTQYPPHTLFMNGETWGELFLYDFKDLEEGEVIPAPYRKDAKKIQMMLRR
ncbi:MAG: tetratricopeptide repeat protein [Bacteroidota bacterium]